MSKRSLAYTGTSKLFIYFDGGKIRCFKVLWGLLAFWQFVFLKEGIKLFFRAVKSVSQILDKLKTFGQSILIVMFSSKVTSIRINLCYQTLI